MKKITLFLTLIIVIATPMLAFAQQATDENLTQTDVTAAQNAVLEQYESLLETPIFDGYVKGQVNDVSESKEQIMPGSPMHNPKNPDLQYATLQTVTFEVSEGEYKGIIFEAKNELLNQIFDLPLKKGDKIMLSLKVYKDGSIEGFATDYIRSHIMVWLIVLFIIGVLLIGKMKGLRAIVSLGITIGSIFFILIPATISGYNAIVVSILLAIAVTIVTIVMISGFNKKSTSAIVGTIGGVILAGLIAYTIGKITMLTGLAGEDARILYLNKPELNFFNIFFASIIIGSLGAVMDVGMSIASAVNEIAQAKPNSTSRELFTAGMNIGKDIMGTMSNTLILAYVGSSFPLLLLFALNDFDTMHIINFDFMAAEIVRSISGSFGLLLAIPITAFFAAKTLGKSQKIQS
jgi:uncharacterized membrane protein